jgi:hypothetical protein
VVRGLSQRPKLTDGPIQRPGRKRNWNFELVKKSVEVKHTIYL